MLYLIGSMALGLLGATATLIALRGHPRAAAWFILATQPLGTAYDIVTRQYGFLVLSVMGVWMGVSTIRGLKTAPLTVTSPPPTPSADRGQGGTHAYAETV
jgi:hypothetical protein